MLLFMRMCWRSWWCASSKWVQLRSGSRYFDSSQKALAVSKLLDESRQQVKGHSLNLGTDKHVVTGAGRASCLLYLVYTCNDNKQTAPICKWPKNRDILLTKRANAAIPYTWPSHLLISSGYGQLVWVRLYRKLLVLWAPEHNQCSTVLDPPRPAGAGIAW